MNLSQRERLLRAMVAGLLLSDLRRDELRKLAQTHLRDPDVTFELVTILEAMLSAIDAPRLKEFVPALTDNKVKEELFDAIDRRRMSKRELMNLLTNAYPDYRTLGVSDDMTAKEMIGKFLEVAPTEAAYHLLVALSGSKRLDPYLYDIIRRHGVK